ncbi:MAG: DegT/DnrJ/EryC1/StrS aminotransferase family protein, partial [Clostridiales bacterium]|nr:DegT/DnrJ/EryC1/StrS aminotransferase family protein [Clostridiales bacterium]
MKVPFSPPDISENEINRVVEVLKSGWITTGPTVKEFEEKMSEFLGTNKTVAFSSATAALEGALRILGIGAGDEVIVPAYTYTATASPVIHVGATLKM